MSGAKTSRHVTSAPVPSDPQDASDKLTVGSTPGSAEAKKTMLSSVATRTLVSGSVRRRNESG